jgi:beta-lactamase superfamily II metal-dependent hydrolase
LLANLVIVPLSSLALMCNLGSLVCGGWWPGVAELFNWSAWFWMWRMIRGSEFATELPGAFCYVRSFTLAEMLLYYGLLVGFLSGWLVAKTRRKWTLPALGVVLAVYCLATFLPDKAVTLTAIPLNGGSAIFCDVPGRRHDLLVDCGQTNAVEFVTKPFLHAQGINRLSQLLLTHGDLRQMGGAENLMRDFDVRRVLGSEVRQLSPTYRRVMDLLAEAPERFRLVQRGERIEPWQVLHPLATDRFRQADDNAVVLRGTFHGTRVLLLSDLGRSGQEALMEREPDLRADFVLAGLPTQGEPLCNGLMERIKPQVVVLMDSEFPATERVTDKLRTRLSSHGATVLCLRDAGAAELELSPTGWRLRTTRGLPLKSSQRD